MKHLTQAANKYISKGISVIPTDAVKRSIVTWKPYQEGIATPEQVAALFSNPKAVGIAAICGKVSGNMEVIDIDTKYDLTGELYAAYMGMISDHNSDLFSRLMIVSTVNGGFHLYYRCPVIEGNQPLAKRPASESELKEKPNEKVKVLIETRGEGGYVIAPPSDGYKRMQGGEIPFITENERALLHDLARSFNLLLSAPDPIKTLAVDTKQFGLSPFEDYNHRGDCEQVLRNHGWTMQYERAGKRYYRRPGKDEGISGDFWPEKRWFSVFTTSSEFEANKAYSPAGVFAMLECGNDFSKAAAMLLDAGYGEKRVSYGKLEGDVLKKKRDGVDREDIVQHIVKNYDNVKDAKHAQHIIKKIEQQHGEDVCTFWDVCFDKEGRVEKIVINRFKLERFLSDDGGFGLYFYDKSSNIFKIIQERNGLVREASTEEIKKYVKDYILNLPDAFDGITKEALLEVIYKGAETYFSKSFFEFLERKEIDFLKDTATEAYFPFNNGVVVATKDKVVVKSYVELGKSMWSSQVKDFNIDILNEIDIEDSEYCKFVQKIAGDDKDRIEQAFGLIGYTLHKFKDETKPFAVILAEETEDESKGGGTGKGIFFKAISKLINVVFIDGKTMDLNKSFAWQRVGLDTQLIVIEDCRKNVDFEGFYSKITEGLTVEKKNKDEIYLGYEDAPKFGFTTNYSITLKGNHGKRRGKIIEFSNFFHPGNTPEDHFNHKLFSGWDRDEWNRFYNFMFWCVSYYLMAGVQDVTNSVTLKRKQVKLNYGEEFMEWWDGYSSNGCENWKPFKDMYAGFLNESDQDKKNFSQRRFKKALEESSGNFGYTLETQRNWSVNGQHELRVMKN
jgi:hypothetical protein